MSQAQQQFIDFATDYVESSLRFARISLDSVERVTKLNLETAKSSLEDSAKNAKALASVKDVQEGLVLRQKLGEAGVEQFSAYSKSLYDIASQAQAEIAKLIEERTTVFNKDVVSGLDRFVKSAPAGTDVAVAAVKSTVQATAAAVDSLTKAAKQVADFTDASVKAATTATADAVKAATKRAANSSTAA
ncbi:phasin family protein [Chitinolyticbacter albus]|uniref:phasin family protein n=1 Tax=Chitinolyticbacter albus TaxID=2961951 RepID=UPI00210DC05B|nr:phasin family protein [Chitinolyticbacter albus]